MPGDFDEIQNKKASVALGLPVDFVKKDFFITKAIKILTCIDDPYFSLVSFPYAYSINLKNSLTFLFGLV